MATGARFVIGFEPVARPNYPAAAGSCTQSHTHSVDTDRYGRMSVEIMCPPSAEHYTFPAIITIYR